MRTKMTALLATVALLAGCGDGGGGSGGVATTPTGAATPTPTATAAAGCSLRARQDWAAAQIREWYLFPDTLPASLDPSPYTTVDAYIDALTATARAQRKDRYFTYLTSIKGEDAYYDSGASGGFGFRLGIDAANRRVFIAESFEGTPALAAGIDRGTEIIAIGTSASDLRTTSAIIAAEGPGGVTKALGDDSSGLTRLLRISVAGVTRDVTLAKADYTLTPVSSRYGAQIINDGGRQVGYINLRTFISTADPALREAFARFRAAGITNVIVDLRYNGGGLISIAELFSDLLGGARSTSDVVDYVSFRPEKASNNTTRTFQPQPQSIAPTKIAFIGTGGTASASELVINTQVPFLQANAALVGTNTYGKPVGQIALDNAACDDRLRLIALAIQNADRQGAYYDGLAAFVKSTCQAGDDLTYQLGDPREASTRAALNFLAGQPCTRITASNGDASAQSVSSRTKLELLTPDRPDTAQRETPGLF